MSSIVLYSARTKTHKTHKSSKIDYNTRALFSTHRNACVKQDCLKFRTIFGTHRKRIFQVRLNTSLAPYSSLTETHMSSNIASSPALCSAHSGKAHVANNEAFLAWHEVTRFEFKIQMVELIHRLLICLREKFWCFYRDIAKDFVT